MIRKVKRRTLWITSVKAAKPERKKGDACTSSCLGTVLNKAVDINLCYVNVCPFPDAQLACQC